MKTQDINSVNTIVMNRIEEWYNSTHTATEYVKRVVDACNVNLVEVSIHKHRTRRRLSEEEKKSRKTKRDYIYEPDGTCVVSIEPNFDCSDRGIEERELTFAIDIRNEERYERLVFTPCEILGEPRREDREEEFFEFCQALSDACRKIEEQVNQTIYVD